MTQPFDETANDEAGSGSTSTSTGVMAGFARFKRGVTARAPQTREVTHVIQSERTPVDVPTVNGQAVGEVASVDFWISLQQLELAPKEDLLCSRYDPNEDADFDRLKNTLDQLGDQVPSLPVLPAHRNMIVDGVEQPIFQVYDRPEVYYALIHLKRARAKAHIPAVQHPGQILLQALATHGQLRREPSYLEICLAARRLKETYGYTLMEIAQMQARDPDDNTPPSTTQVHYEILVAGLPPAVHDLLHRRHILWSHAKNIAEYCGEDAGLSTQLALYISQGGTRKSVEALGYLINRLKDGQSRLETDNQGIVHALPVGKSLSAVPDKPSPSARPMVFYQRMMAAPPAQVRKAAAGFAVQLIPADTPEKIAVSAQSLDPLRQWLADRRSHTAVRDVEAMLLGYLEALRGEGLRQGLINRDGALSPVVDAADGTSSAISG